MDEKLTDEEYKAIEENEAEGASDEPAGNPENMDDFEDGDNA